MYHARADVRGWGQWFRAASLLWLLAGGVVMAGQGDGLLGQWTLLERESLSGADYAYALALSRRTGLKLYDFVRAWFDEHAYYEFYPLHVVHKRAGKRQGG